ncbi:MAG: SdrD B-like domain-containing protein, partial [Campylobacterota bacterium]|nr:SdrD B-like domain-containing protein [Campylobacterota bacterium]
LISGENDVTWDMGVYQTASIGNRIWLDTNADGIQDVGELNVTDANIIIELIDENNNTVQTINGITDGLYAFDNIYPSSYQIRFRIPTNYIVSPQDTTGTNVDDMTDSDLNATTLLTDMTILSSGENDISWDVGIFVPASFGNRIWLDTNADGIQDATEGNFTEEVTIVLLDENNNTVKDASGNAVNSITTQTGAYNFRNLVPASYHVVFTLPTGVTLSPLSRGVDSSLDSDVNVGTNATVNTVLESGENDTSWDAGVYVYASIGDTIWIDNNGNGLQDDSETLDINVTVNLYNSDNTLADTQTVAAGGNGAYLFENIVPNSYYVEFVLPSSSEYIFTSRNEGSDDSLDSDVDASGRTTTEVIVSGESNLTLDAGIYVPATIGDRVWLDANANGIQDLNENGIADLNVTLFDEDNVSVDMVVTDENGTYVFTGLIPADYHVVFALSDENGQSYVVSTANIMIDADDTNNSDCNAQGVTRVETLISGENNRDYDAGLYTLLSIGNFVWSDENGNGIQDVTEPGLENINVTLFREETNGTTTTVGITSTNSNGEYLFTSLVPGYYYVHFETLEHFRVTVENSGSNDALDSDINTITGQTSLFELLSPYNNMTIDAGFYELATISGTVSEDTDNDDLADVMLEGVTIDLLDSNGTVISTTTTDSNGSYIFIDVEPGTYTVVETQPSGLLNVSENEGGADGDVGNTILDNIISVIVGIGENDTLNDFVEESGITIGDRVWIDSNGDGIQDSSETSNIDLSGISVNLLLDGVVVASTDTDALGNYLFEDYAEGNYSIEFDLSTLPEHYGVTKENEGNDDTNDSDANIETGITSSEYLIPGDDIRTFDMGIYLLGTISGMVLEDINDDNIGDRPMADITINLYDENGNLVATTVTDANGYYEFSGLPQGTYTIHEIQPNGYLDVGETNGDYPDDNTINTITIDLDAGEHDEYNDFTEEIGGSIGNYVWYDKNGDGLQNSDETGVNAVHVCLEDDQGNAILDANSTQRCTDTNATGYYLFEGVLPGNYVVVFEIPDGTTLTPFPQEGSDSDKDSNPLEVIGGYAHAAVTLNIGEDILHIDMGLVYLNNASIGDFVWIDENEDGIFDNHEVGLDGATVNLYDLSGNLLETIVTHDGGKYLFEHLAEGTYVVEFIVPNEMGYEFTQENIGGTGELDSDANVLTGRTEPIVLREGEHIVIVDAGVYCGCEDAPIKANGGDALGFLGMLLMMLSTLMTALFFVRKEEEQRV